MKELLKNIRMNQEDEYINTLFDLCERREIPQSYNNDFLNSFKNLGFRFHVIEKHGYPLVSWDWIDILVSFIGDSKCLEVMGGLGTISYALRQKNVDIICTDNGSWDDKWLVDKWTDVEKKDAIEAIKEYGTSVDYIIMSWPYMDDTAYRCLQTMREINPECKMIVIGEGYGGCTADDDFFENIVIIEDSLIDEMNKKYQTWMGIHDYIELVK